MAMDTERRENIKRICRSFSNPVIVMDFDFTCLFCNQKGFIKAGSSMKLVFRGIVTLPLEKPLITAAEIKGVPYGVRLTELDERLYICEFFDDDTLLSLVENSGFYEKVFPVIDTIERNTASLWHGFHILESKLIDEGQEETAGCAAQLEKHLTRLNSATKNVSEYLHMLSFPLKPRSVIDLSSLLVGLVARCNTALLKSGRYVDIFCESDMMYIYAEQRHAVTAAVNAVQNALLYSPRDCIPQVSLSKITADGVPYVMLKITNENALFVEENDDGETRVNLAHQRTGFGIPIIKRFAEMCGGEFFMTEQNGMVNVTILLRFAEVTCDKIAVGSSVFEYYQTEIPDILDLQMEEVNEIFG